MNHPVLQALINAGPTCQDEDFFKRSFFIGFSGGLDSTVLTHALMQLAQVLPIEARRLNAIHVNHRLQPAAIKFERHCRQMAETWGIQLAVKRPAAVKGQAVQLGLEASARLRRYSAFEEVMGVKPQRQQTRRSKPLARTVSTNENRDSSWPVLVLAHHANDQVETALLQWMRGAGLEGLSAMPMLSRRQGYFLWRPLLQLTRGTLEDYASCLKLPFVEDPSNSLPDQDRNRLRQQVFPVLNAMRPGSVAAMARSVQHLQQARQLLDQLDQDDLARCTHSTLGLCLEPFLALPVERQLRTLRAWLVGHQGVSGATMPPARRLEEFLRQLRTVRNGRRPVLAVKTPSTGGSPSFRVRLRAGFLTVEWI